MCGHLMFKAVRDLRFYPACNSLFPAAMCAKKGTRCGALWAGLSSDASAGGWAKAHLPVAMARVPRQDPKQILTREGEKVESLFPK